MPEDHMARSDLAKAALAAWVNVPVDQLPAEKMWIEHPNDLNRQAWDRVIAAAQRPLLDRIAELEGERTADAIYRREETAARLAAEAQVSALTRENEGLREAVKDACDLLAERTYGSRARSPGHNARLRLEAALPQQGGA